ncbi:MAG: metallophosphoesterase family protein [Rhizobiales bacterium]|nr:metallophosphoesterase family protein [Hyphomicrobiales bacterium]
MLIALIADIHGNDLALEACLEQVERRGATRIVFLGDLVGYGAEPERVVRRVMDHMARGAVALKGNHDQAVNQPMAGMNDAAALAIAWTRRQLSPEAGAFLASLPLTAEADDCLFVHADASAPRSWRYVINAEDARLSFASTTARVTFCGHVHVPALFCLSPTGKLVYRRPTTNVGIVLSQQRRWLAVIGSAGQPRDDNPAAAFATYDTETRMLTFCRAPYDAAAAAAKIRAAGLPDWLAARLMVGR